LLQGWVANRLDPDYDSAAETLDYLAAVIKAPLLGEFPFRRNENDKSGAGEPELDFLM